MKVVTWTCKMLGRSALAFVFAVHALGNQPLESESTEDLLSFRLMTVPERWLFDMHGNADDVVKELMNRRFEATAAICQHLDESKLGDGYIEALLRVLAVVKDPAAIPWLEKQWSKDPERMAEMWLGRHWAGHLGGASRSELKWLTGTNEWAAFFRRRATEEPELKHRVQLLRVLAGWFHDEKTIALFTDLEKAGSGGETLLIAQLYLLNHKQAFDAKRTAEAVNELGSSPSNTNLLMEYADQIRHEAFVPWLVSVAGLEVDHPWLDPQSLLEKITFCRGIKKKEDWEKWLQLHGAEVRQVWIAQAMTEFNQVLKRHPGKAKTILKDNLYRWDDLALLPYVKEFLPSRKLHNELVAWISLSYRPCWRAELQGIAEQIILRSRKDLEDWAVTRLKELGFQPSKEETWADWVRGLNSSI